MNESVTGVDTLPTTARLRSDAALKETIFAYQVVLSGQARQTVVGQIIRATKSIIRLVQLIVIGRCVCIGIRVDVGIWVEAIIIRVQIVVCVEIILVRIGTSKGI